MIGKNQSDFPNDKMINYKPILFAATLSVLSAGCATTNQNSDSSDNSDSSETKEVTGMLLVLEPEKCPLAEGCGPRFSLLGGNLQSQVALQGDFSPDYNNLILTVTGTLSPLPESLSGQSGYERINFVLTANKFQQRSSIPYHDFLVKSASAYTMQNLGCEVLWDKSYAWTIANNRPQLIVRMTDTFASSPQPYLQLSYDGNTGELLDAISSPPLLQPCG